MDTSARILVDGELVLDRADVHLRVDDNGPLKRWRGSFAPDNAWSMISKGSNCVLELDDGRSGEFVASNIGRTASIPPTVFFVGSGPLE